MNTRVKDLLLRIGQIPEGKLSNLNPPQIASSPYPTNIRN